MKPINYIHPNSKLVFLSITPTDSNELKYRKKRALYKCSCGKTKIIMISEVKNGNTLSCGCFQKEQARNRLLTHGLTNHPLFSIWRTIICRCYNKNAQNYKNYGGRGVTMCDEWRNSFKSFYDWCILNGWSSGLQIDKDAKSDKLGIIPIYSPDTCTIMSGKENSRKKRTSILLTLNGETNNITDWATFLGVKRGTLYDRVALGWTDEKILTHPKRS